MDPSLGFIIKKLYIIEGGFTIQLDKEVPLELRYLLIIKYIKFRLQDVNTGP